MVFQKRYAIIAAVLLSCVCAVSFAQRREAGLSKFYKDWLDKDVVYIISGDERRLFKDLRNDEEREAFIQQFWDRRNPDSRSSYNSFREEHYRRIAYANDNFASGVPGWRTDRGRVYIIHGPPDDRETRPTGGSYYRSWREGGGHTVRFPYEIWWYRFLEGVGHGVELMFVDNSISNEYRLAMYPDEADALLNVPGAGLTVAEEMGFADKYDRAYYNPSGWYDYSNPQATGSNTMDSPFTRMAQYFDIQRAPSIKFDDLKSVVTTNITYSSITFDVRTDYLRLSDDKVLVPVSLEIKNSELEFRKDKGFNRAKLNVYGIITGLTNKIHAEWEDEVARDFLDVAFEQGRDGRSTYQRIIALPPGQRYKLDLVVRDVNSKKVGSVSQGLNVPRYTETGLQMSTVILANDIHSAPASATTLEQYVIGDLRVKPNVRAEYVPGQNLIPYAHIYGMGIDQSTQNPSIEVEFAIKSGEEVLEKIPASATNSEQLFYPQRVVLVGMLPVGNFAPGKYQLEIRVLDKISNNRATVKTDFTVKAPPDVLAEFLAEEESE